MLIPVIIGVTFIVFFILNLSPGDPAAIILGDQASAEALAMKRKELGLDDPLLVRYGHYMINMLHGDLPIFIHFLHLYKILIVSSCKLTY